MKSSVGNDEKEEKGRVVKRRDWILTAQRNSFFFQYIFTILFRQYCSLHATIRSTHHNLRAAQGLKGVSEEGED